MSIHPTAILSDRATISPDAEIGPYCVIDGEVEIGPGTVVESHARIGSRYGRVTIGANNRIQHGAVLGGPPQDLGYEGGSYTALQIGSDNRIGEFVSINVGTEKGGGVTRAVNRVGLKRAGFDAGERRNIDNALRFVLDRALTIDEVTARIGAECRSSPQIEHLLSFIRSSERGIARG